MPVLTEYRNLTPWKHPADYGGAAWYGWYAVYGQHRDSDALERSNYKSILAELHEDETASWDSWWLAFVA